MGLVISVDNSVNRNTYLLHRVSVNDKINMKHKIANVLCSLPSSLMKLAIVSFDMFCAT